MIIKKYLSMKEDKGGYLIHCDSADLMLLFMTPDIIRIRVSFSRCFPEASYALIRTAWDDDLDDLFKKERRRIEALQAVCHETDKKVIFCTGELTLEMVKEPFYIRILNSRDQCIYSDLPGKSYEKDHLGRIYHYSFLDSEKDHFYGFGETTGNLDKKGLRIRLAPKDALGHDPEYGQPLYMNIPFYIKINENTNYASGFFYNNTFDCVFDMGNEIGGYLDRYYYYQTDGGDIDLFFINGPSVENVLKHYTFLTGRIPLPPKYSLGYIASTMYYTELDRDCDKKILDVIDQYIEKEIWVDNFQLASGYSSGEKDDLRYVFNWNKNRFPEPLNFIQEMLSRGINVIPNLKPGILKEHPYMDVFVKHNAFIKTFDGKEDYIGRWWGGPGKFLDFTNPGGRAAWKELLKKTILEKGITTVWNDNCEYDGIDDRNALCCFEGKGANMAQLKSVQANMMAYCGQEALEEVYPNLRPYQINRAGFAGIQRYSQVWGGDNMTDWRTLRFNIYEIMGMGLSGLANTGCDIGGFTGKAPDPELMLRWIQNGIFQPRFCINSANTDNSVTQPFMYPEILEEIKQAYSLRYRMIPYLYSLFWEAHNTGLCMIRPLFMEFPDDPYCYQDNNFTFMFGKNILVANVLEKNACKRSLYLPAGCNWYYINETLSEYEGGQTIEIPVDLSSIPIFLRGDGIFVTSDDIHRIQKDTVKNLEILIASQKKTNFVYYDDDGYSRDYEKGIYFQMNIEVTPGKVTTIHFTKEGTYTSDITDIYLRFISKDKGAFYVNLNGKPLPSFIVADDWKSSREGWYYNLSSRTIDIKLKMPVASDFCVAISREKFDLIKI